MVKIRQPPIYLMRVLRAVAGLHEPNGVTVARIIKQLREDLSCNGRTIRNLTMYVRRALNYAVDIGALKHKAGKYKMVGKRKVFPVDSLEMLMDSRSRKSKKVTFKKKQTSKRSYKKQTDTKSQSKKRSKTGNTKANLRIERKKSQSSSDCTVKSQDDDLKMETINGPDEKNKDLVRKISSKRQTSYPKYNDTMPGDDQKVLQNVPQRPRRKRPAVLPDVNRPNDENNAGGNTVSMVVTALLILSLWHGLHQAMQGT